MNDEELADLYDAVVDAIDTQTRHLTEADAIRLFRNVAYYLARKSDLYESRL